jgi:hypothetical protein
MAIKSLECPKCGAPIPVEGDTRRLTCAFCGAPLDLGVSPAGQTPTDSPEARVRAALEAQRQGEEEGYRRAKEEDNVRLAEERLRADESRRQIQELQAGRGGVERRGRRRTHLRGLFFWLLVLLAGAFFLSPSRLPAPWQSRRAEAIRLVQTAIPRVVALLPGNLGDALTRSGQPSPARVYSDEFFAADSVAHIRLTVLTPSDAIWNDVGGKTVAVVERQDGAGVWRAVQNWARVPNGPITWAVARKDYGSSPFRWVIYAGATPLGVSRPFRLPTGDGHMTDVVVSLSRLPG